MSLMDINQDAEIARLKRKVKELEKIVKGENEMSRLIKELVGHTVKIDFYGTVRVLDCDEDWIKIEETNKKGASTIKLIPIDDIADGEITVIE